MAASRAIDRDAMDRELAVVLAARDLAGMSVGISVPGERAVRPTIFLQRSDGTFETVFAQPGTGGEYARTSRVSDVFFYLHFLYHEHAGGTRGRFGTDCRAA